MAQATIAAPLVPALFSRASSSTSSSSSISRSVRSTASRLRRSKSGRPPSSCSSAVESVVEISALVSSASGIAIDRAEEVKRRITRTLESCMLIVLGRCIDDSRLVKKENC